MLDRQTLLAIAIEHSIHIYEMDGAEHVGGTAIACCKENEKTTSR